MANKTINDLTELAEAPADDDAMIIRDTSGPNDRKLLCKYFAKTDGTEITFTGGGVGVTEAGDQVLTNKELTAPDINLPTLVLKQSTTPLPTAEGDIQWDTNGDFIVVGNGVDQTDIPSATSTHTFTNKTFTTPVVTSPTLRLLQEADPEPTDRGDIRYNTDKEQLMIGDGAASWGIWSADDETSTLENKTLVTPGIASFANATHDHADAAGGGDIFASPTFTTSASVSAGTYGGTPSGSSIFLVEDDTNAYVTIGTPSTNFGLLAFADVENNSQGYVKYDHNADLMEISAATYDVRINTNGVGLGGNPVSGSPLTVYGNNITITTTKTPASAGATGIKGQIAYDTNYFYVCTATNTWTRIALAW